MKIIYGTTNLKKKQQVEDFFKATGITNLELISAKDIGFFEEIIEDGKTFEENSLIKAKAIKKFCDKNKIEGIVVTDDTGLCVDCLNGEPGIYSARYVSKKEHPNDHQEASIKKLLENIEKTGDKERKAKFVCVLTAIMQNGDIKQVRGETLGTIAKTPGPMGKLTYGPIFIPEGFNKCMNELRDDELGTTHREKAFLELLKILQNTNNA